MINGDIVVRTRDLTKTFRIFARASDYLAETVLGKQRHRELRAIDNVSFALTRGEVVGLIGPNGAGKSTLVKLLTGTLIPSTGSVEINGTVKAVSELGIGFNNEYTGWDNVILGGLSLGYRRSEIEGQRNWIARFSELDEALERPLSTYSAGMRARLGFCVSFCIVPDILIIDETLSVGDAAFSAKCVHFLRELSNTGRTVVVVSHNMDLVRRICGRALYLLAGRLEADGSPETVVIRHETEMARRFVANLEGPSYAPASATAGVADAAVAQLPEAVRSKLKAGESMDSSEIAAFPFLLDLRLIRLESFEVRDCSGVPVSTVHCGDPVVFRVVLASRVRWNDLNLGLQIYNATGTLISSINSAWTLDADGRTTSTRLDCRPGRIVAEFSVGQLALGAGYYTVSVGVAPLHTLSEDTKLLYAANAGRFAVVRRDLTHQVAYEPLGTWKISVEGNKGVE